MRSATLLLIVALVAPGVSGQEPDHDSRRLSVSVTMSRARGGPASAIASHLRRLGFDDTRPHGCGLFGCDGPTDYPRLNPGLGTDVTVRYELGPRWAASVGVGSLDLGLVQGYRAFSSPRVSCSLGCVTITGEHVDSQWHANANWIGVHLKPSPRLADKLSIGGGVSRYAFRRVNSPLADDFEGTRFGVMAEAALRLARGSHGFYGLTVRAHMVPGSADVPHATSGSSVLLRATWSHVTVGFSAGLRL